jgi:hypothetical protein
MFLYRNKNKIVVENMMKYFAFLIGSFVIIFALPQIDGASDPLTRTVHKYGLILDECILDGKPLKKDSKGAWGYYVTISQGVDFGSDIDSRWLRIEFQYFPEKKHIEFTIYSSTVSRQGKWEEIVGFRTKLEEKKMDFESADTWQVIAFENEKIKLKFKFFHAKAR